MSFHKLPLDLSPAAQEDRIAIIHYTALQWGEAQARIYHAAIDDAFDTLCRHPAIGYKSPELPDYYRLYPVGSHVIAYYQEGDVINVARILHQRMSLRRHISM
jgi:plasmid stabilization system protein ParE